MRVDLRLLRRLEAHAVDAWPATVTERVDGGWVLRATPGLDRGRSNHALPPCRPLWAGEVAGAIERVEAFARAHEVHPGIQVSPLSLHGTLQAELDRARLGTRWPVLVLAASRAATGVVGPPGWIRRLRCRPRHAAVAGCVGAVRAGPRRGGPRRDGVPAARRPGHVRPRWRTSAVGIGVEGDGLVGLFCLAVDPARRRSGLGTALVRALLAGSRGERRLSPGRGAQRAGGGAIPAARVRRGVSLLPPRRPGTRREVADSRARRPQSIASDRCFRGWPRE